MKTRTLLLTILGTIFYLGSSIESHAQAQVDVAYQGRNTRVRGQVTVPSVYRDRAIVTTRPRRRAVEVRTRRPVTRPRVYVEPRCEVIVPAPRRPIIRRPIRSIGNIVRDHWDYGYEKYFVEDAYIRDIGRGKEIIHAHMTNGDDLDIVIYTGNTYNNNYQMKRRGSNHYGRRNLILSVKLNGQRIPMEASSLSLRPVNGGTRHTAILNLHSHHDGDFTGRFTF